MKAFARKWRKQLLLIALVTGIYLLHAGYQLATWQSPQVANYNLGIDAYKHGDMAKAIRYFDRSIAGCRAEQNASWWHRFVYPKPSVELVAMANFQRGKAFFQLQQAEAAVQAFKQSNNANPGDLVEEYSAKEIDRLYEEALTVKYDLEFLYKARPDLQMKEGKGKGRGQGRGKQAPGSDPGSQSGKGRPDDI